MKKRSKLEITLQVLHSIYRGTGKTTHIMYDAGVSWVHLKRILDSMISQGLVEEIEASSLKRRGDGRTSVIYQITEKGVNVLSYFKKAKEFQLVDLAVPY
jgi:predicted transcriptional regulator